MLIKLFSSRMLSNPDHTFEVPDNILLTNFYNQIKTLHPDRKIISLNWAQTESICIVVLKKS